MGMDDNDDQMIFGDLGGLKLPDICLTVEEKPRKNLTQETCPDRGSNPFTIFNKLKSRGNTRDSHSGGPGFKSRGRPTWLRFLVVFFNLKIAKELVIFKDKCRVGPHIPLKMCKFNVSQDLKPLLLTKC